MTRSDVVTTTSRTYDTHNNVLTETDALGKMTVSTYDARDRKATRTDRINALTTFRYDLVGNLTRIIDAEGNELVPGLGVTDYTYDGRNLPKTETFPTGSAGRTYAYDPGKRLVVRQVSTDPVSAFHEVTSYYYDGANRLKTREYPDGKNDTFDYDLASRLNLAITARYGITVNRYHVAGGRLTSETQAFTNGSLSGSTVLAQAIPIANSQPTAWQGRGPGYRKPSID